MTRDTANVLHSSYVAGCQNYDFLLGPQVRKALTSSGGSCDFYDGITPRRNSLKSRLLL